jgi:hypothetical protein
MRGGQNRLSQFRNLAYHDFIWPAVETSALVDRHSEHDVSRYGEHVGGAVGTEEW